MYTKKACVLHVRELNIKQNLLSLERAKGEHKTRIYLKLLIKIIIIKPRGRGARICI